MPLTWDPTSPPPLAPDPGATSPGFSTATSGGVTGTDRTPRFEAGDFIEAESTLVTSGMYELRPRFTGRSAAIARLHELVDRALDDRDSAFVVVLGEPGMGKSRLIGELTARLRTARPRSIIVQGIADENAPTYGPIARALSTRFALDPGEPADASRAKIMTAVSEVMPAQKVPEVGHLIAHLLRVPFDDSPVVGPLMESPQRLEARLFMALKRYLAAETERQPVVLLIENLELCGNDTINFLHYLAAGLREHRLAIVGTATPALYERHPAFGDGEIAPERIELAGLAAAEAEELLRELCRYLADIPRELVEHVRKLGGSPRAIVELVRLLIESGVIERRGIVWRLDRVRLVATRLPATYDDVVAARLRVMDATERRVLEMAAVVGEVCWLDAILALVRHGHHTGDPDGPTLAQIAASGDHSRLEVVAALGKLVEREWLLEAPSSTVAGERELRFAYPNLWSVIYVGIDEGTRRTYHGAVARWLELHPEGLAPAAQEEVARHLALAGELREAASRYRRSAEAARAAFHNDRAIQLFDRALACINSADTGDLSARLGIWHDLGSVYELIGDFEAALGAFERMLRLSWVAASKTKAAVAFNKLGRVWRRKGDLRLALEYLERGHDLFRAAGDQRGIAGSLDDIGKVLHMLGRTEEAHAKISEALDRRGRHGDRRAIATSLSRLGEVHQDRGAYDAAFGCHQEALELRQAAGDRWGVIVSQNALAALSFELGNFAEARTGWLAALPAAEGIGALPLCALLLTNLGELALVEGKQEEARRRLDTALEIIEDIEDRGLETECCRHLATLDKLAGHTESARELAERALAVARLAGLREAEAKAQLTLADVLATNLYDTDGDASGPTPAAVAFTAAIDLLRSIRNEAALARALHAYGRYTAEVGDISGGKDMLRDALLTFTRLGLARPAAEIEKLLSALS